MSVDVPKDWTKTDLGEICTEHSRRAKNSELEIFSVSKDYGLIAQSELFERRIASADTSNYKTLKHGEYAYDPMLLWTGSIGCLWRAPEAMISPAYTTFSIDNRKVLPKFFDTLIKMPKMVERYRSISHGTNVRRKKAHFDDFSRLVVALPPLAEQIAIAEVLGAMEDAIAKAEALIGQLKGVSTSTLSDRISCFSLDTASVNIGSILLEGPKSGFSPVCKDEPPGIGVLKLSAVTGGRLNWRNNVKFADVPPKAATQFQLEARDFLVIRGSGSRDIVGSGCHVTEADLPPFPCIFPDLVIRLRANSQKVLPEYLAVMWDTQIIRTQIRQAAKSTNGIYKINQTDIRELRIPLPPVGVQREVVMLIAGIHSRLSAEQEMLVRLVATRDALAQELLSGRLRLPESMIARHREKSERAA